GQAGADAVAVVFERVPAFGLQEDLMPFLVGEAHDLVLDGWTVARPTATNLAGVHRRPVEIGANQLVDGFIRVRDVAIHLRLRDLGRREAERPRLGIARLPLAGGEVDGPPVEPARRACLEARKLKTARGEAIAQRFRRLIAGPPTRRLGLAHV